jgi:hypothetical protein
MKLSTTTTTLCACMVCVLLYTRCGNQSGEPKSVMNVTAKADNRGFESKVKFGEHLVTIAACHDCHSPKRMTANGMDIDSSLLLSGHPSQSPAMGSNLKSMASKGLVFTNDLTTWVGPWGTSYTANLTSDETGIGNWTEQQFMYAIHHGKLKGLAGSRDLLPPMPWQMYKHMTDEELKAIFAYLKTTKPIRNIVPAPVPPAGAKPQ